ncbi:MAG: M56 family metallopeptidase [Cellvibrio sp.]|uniref:M56 family metallopeptidase n=1 Tax=Cellvibrio sp. TaxID=1965322 RepID=UPI00271CA956|nr:M56 family metallopeptidase [Cellvibrio sp.]
MSELIQELNSFTGWLLIASLKSLPLIAILLLAQYGLKKTISAGARHGLWLSLFLCLSIPFGWNLSFDNRAAELLSSPVKNDLASISMQEPVKSPTTSTPTIPISPENNIHQSTSLNANTLDYRSILSLIWLLIFCGLVCITFWQVLRFKHVLQKASDATTADYALLERAKQILRLSKTIPLLYSSQVSSPLTLGLFKPRVILPIDINQQLTEKQLNLVLLHELAHIQRRDILWNWVTYGVTLLHWFNPLIWLASKRMKADMEMACDAKVLAHLSPQDRNDYGLTLINLSQLSSKHPRLSHGLGILENHRELKNRLIMMKEFTTMTLKKSLVFGLVFSVFAFAALAQPNNKPNETKTITPPNTNSRMTLTEFAKQAEKDLNTPILVGNALADINIPVSITENPLDYGQLLSQLKINELTAYKSSGYIQIILARDARWLAIPTVEKGKKYFDDEYVTDSIKLDKTCAGSILATLRPLVPQYGHLTTMESANMLIISDFYSNTVRVKAMVKMLEDNTLEKVDCSERNIATKQAPTPEKK